MLTTAYTFAGAVSRTSTTSHSHVRYRAPVAKVIGTERGVPFTLYFKSLTAAQRLAARVWGAELVIL